jgi:diaminopimelate decarboxylase
MCECAGLNCHIGSQLTSAAPFIAALEKLLELVDQLEAEGIVLQHIDMGGTRRQTSAQNDRF